MPTIAARRHAGVSLIELMVALAIGSLLILGLTQVFSASRAASITAEGISRVQENARFAIDFLQRDIRMAGHFGCVNDQAHWVKNTGDLVNHLDATNPALNFHASITGYEAAGTAPGQSVILGAATGTWSPALPAGIAALNPLPGSDIISLRYLAEEGVPANGLTAVSNNTQVSFPGARRSALTSGGVATPTLFGVADCTSVEIFSGTHTAGGATDTVLSTGLLSTTLPDGTVVHGEFSGKFISTADGGNTQLFRAESLVYYVGTGTSGEPSLFRARAGTSGGYVAEELVEGIESLQFLYGRDATAVISQENPPLGNVTLQDPASGLGATDAQWRRVGLVQVGLLARSPTPAAPVGPAATTRVLGVAFNPPATADARYRNSYEVTVALRNRLFGN